MITTVIGSFGIELKEPKTTGEKIKSALGLYDPIKLAIEETVKLQLRAGIDIVGDGQYRGDMVSSFVKHIPGFKYEMNSSIIVSKIKTPQEIMVKDIKYAKKVLDREVKNMGLSDEEIAKKGVKGLVTGPSTIVHSSRIESFYKDKNSAIIDSAHALHHEMAALDKSGACKYIQVDEPFLSTGLVDMKTANEAIAILTEGINVPVGMHVCGNLDAVFKELCKFNIDVLDCEFAGNKVNIGILEENAKLLKGKKLGFGCLDTTLNAVDDADYVESLIKRGIDAVGKENMILDPDCGLRKVDNDIAEAKLKLMCDFAKKYS